jgi:hypothetical protein
VHVEKLPEAEAFTAPPFTETLTDAVAPNEWLVINKGKKLNNNIGIKVFVRLFIPAKQ